MMLKRKHIAMQLSDQLPDELNLATKQEGKEIP
jgi:hypothetical protein